ncbi:hypothetical protein ACFSR7_10420 [Cohnella sp. GCM10020058]|uniref:hypothetical protein n=1 Tax=Cohnella sp. GCM10020058 TaxID=3317330 RepID=UPI0036272CC6
MSMPTIPHEPYRPSLDQVVVDLLKSIALEETALAHLLNAEAEQMRALAHQGQHAASHRARCELMAQAGRQSVRLLDAVVMKEWLLLRKLDNTLDLYRSEHGDKRCDPGGHDDDDE